MLEEEIKKYQTEQPTIKTLCRDCIFATWNNNEQIGCLQNRLTKFVREQIEENDKKYYSIDGICNYCRNEDWKNKLSGDLVEQLEKETNIKVDMIFINTESTESIIEEQIKNHLQKIDEMKVKPCSITFSSLVPINFQWYINTIQQYCKYKYHVVNPILTRELYPVLEMCIARGKANYYLSYYLNTDQDISNCLDRLNYELNTKLTRFIMIKPNLEIDGLLVQRFIHKLLGGNDSDLIVDKINDLNQQQKQNMVLNWKNIVQL